MPYKDPERQREAVRVATERLRARQRKRRPVRSRSAEKYRKRRERFVRDTKQLSPNSARRRNSLLILKALDEFPEHTDYTHAAAVRLLEVVPRFTAEPQVWKWLRTTAKRLEIDEAANTPTTGAMVSVGGDGEPRLREVDVADAIDAFGTLPLWTSENRDWGGRGLDSWYPTHWYDPIQRKSWIRWSYKATKQPVTKRR